MIPKSLFLFPFSLLLLPLYFTETLGQSPAPAPTPRGPTNVVKILKKSGQFKDLVRLLKTTQLDSNLNSQLGNTNNGLTIFAPSDTAFSSLKAGTLDSLTHQQIMELVQFHIVPTFLSTSQFDTVTNPLKTHAGSGDRFQLNVTRDGSSMKIATGLINTTISGTVYSDDHLAIYQVDKVLLPLDIFTPKPPAPAPATAMINAESPDDNGVPKDISGGAIFAMCHGYTVLFRVGIVFAINAFFVTKQEL